MFPSVMRPDSAYITVGLMTNPSLLGTAHCKNTQSTIKWNEKYGFAQPNSGTPGAEHMFATVIARAWCARRFCGKTNDRTKNTNPLVVDLEPGITNVDYFHCYPVCCDGDEFEINSVVPTVVAEGLQLKLVSKTLPFHAQCCSNSTDPNSNCTSIL